MVFLAIYKQIFESDFLDLKMTRKLKRTCTCSHVLCLTSTRSEANFCRTLTPSYEIFCLTAGVFPEGHRKRRCDLRTQQQLLKWAERLVLPELLSTNPSSCLWTKCRCNCHNEIVFLLILINL